MREILFRGKRLDNGDWVEGYLIYDDFECSYRIVTKLEYSTGTFIDTGFAPRVDPKTIGQYTGMNDKNGKKIFEHDVVKQQIGRYDKPTFYTISFLEGSFGGTEIGTDYFRDFYDNEFGLLAELLEVVE